MTADTLNVYTVSEVAARLGVSAQRVRFLLNRGKLAGVRKEAGWLIGEDALADLERRRDYETVTSSA